MKFSADAVTRRQMLRLGLAMAGAPFCATAFANQQSAAPPLANSTRPRPVILDTDIGDDIDDTWALLMLLRIPTLRLELAVGDFGNALYRARLLAKLLESLGRSDIPIGIGMGADGVLADEPGQQSAWLGNYQLDDYPGTVFEDGVQAIIDTIKGSREPVTLLCLGPVPNIAEALRRDPSIADNAHFVGMHGSIYRGYVGDPAPAAEYNVRVDPAALRAAFAASWECTITPLDTCGLVVLDGQRYQSLYTSDDPWLRVLMENYRIWLPGAPFIAPDHDMSRVSTTLFDSVAVHLAAGGDLVQMQRLPLTVTDEGYTVVDPIQGRPVNCALTWKDLDAFKQHLTETMLGESLAGLPG